MSSRGKRRSHTAPLSWLEQLQATGWAHKDQERNIQKNVAGFVTGCVGSEPEQGCWGAGSQDSRALRMSQTSAV